ERLAFSVELMGGASARSEIKLQARGTHVFSGVRAGAALTLASLAPTAKRGRIPLGRLTLSSDFPLGLWRGWAYVHFPLEGIAYPKPEASAPPLPQGPGGPDAFATGRGGDADLAGIREYQRGDPPQRVAWKAVARGAGWFTKAFDGTGGGGPVTLDYAALPREVAASRAPAARHRSAWTGARRATRVLDIATPRTLFCGAHGAAVMGACSLRGRDRVRHPAVVWLSSGSRAQRRISVRAVRHQVS